MASFRNFTRASFKDFTRASFRDFTMISFRDFTRASFRDFTRASFRDFTRAYFRDFTSASFRDFTMASFRDFTRASFRDFTMASSKALVKTLDKYSLSDPILYAFSEKRPPKLYDLQPPPNLDPSLHGMFQANRATTNYDPWNSLSNPLATSELSNMQGLWLRTERRNFNYE